MRADNYALSEETKRLRDQEQARLTDRAYAEALRLLDEAPALLDRVAAALLEKETLVAGGAARALRRTSSPSRAPRETVGSRSRSSATAADSAGSIRRVAAAASTTSASRSRISTRRVDTYARLFGAELEHRDDAWRSRASRRRRSASAASRVELLAALGDDTPVGTLPREARPRHAPRRVRGRRHPRRARRSRGARRRADRRGAARGPVRPRGRVRPPGLRPRRSLGGGVSG